MKARCLTWAVSGAACAVAIAAVTLVPMRAAAQGGVSLAPHRAVYDLSLAAARGGSGVGAVAGRIAYELTGSACEGYTQVMRFVTRMTNQSGGVVLSDMRSNTWEAGDAKRFRFDSTQLQDERLAEATAGDASRRSVTEDAKVDLTKPAKKSVTIAPRTYFPMEHAVALIAAAKEGKTSFRANFYDGSAKGEKVYDTRAAIGKEQPPTDRKLADAKGADRLKAVRGWPVSIAFFEPNGDRGDALPVYELAYVMLENGVSKNLYIDYGGFALKGELREITFLPPSKCDRK
jgi:hypothetical protein